MGLVPRNATVGMFIFTFQYKETLDTLVTRFMAVKNKLMLLHLGTNQNHQQ